MIEIKNLKKHLQQKIKSFRKLSFPGELKIGLQKRKNKGKRREKKWEWKKTKDWRKERVDKWRQSRHSHAVNYYTLVNSYLPAPQPQMSSKWSKVVLLQFSTIALFGADDKNPQENIKLSQTQFAAISIMSTRLPWIRKEDQGYSLKWSSVSCELLKSDTWSSIIAVSILAKFRSKLRLEGTVPSTFISPWHMSTTLGLRTRCGEVLT